MFEFPKRSLLLTLIFFAGGVAVTAYLIFAVLKTGEYRGYSLKLVVRSAEGLGEGSPVVLSGVQVGKISKVELSQDGKNAILLVQIKRNIKITKDANFSIKMKGVLGDRYISVIQGDSDEYFKDGDVVVLERDSSEISRITEDIGELSKNFSRTLEEIRALAKNINSLVDDLKNEKLAARLGDTLSNSSSAVQEIRYLVEDARDTVRKIDNIIEGFQEPAKKFSSDITKISDNIKELSEKLNKVASSLEREGIQALMGEDREKIKNLVNDIDSLGPKVKEIVYKTDSLISDVKKNLEKASSIDVGIGAKIEGGIKDGKFVGSEGIFATFMRNKRLFLDFGVISPPGENTVKFNSILGLRNKVFSSGGISVGAGFLRSSPSFIFDFAPYSFIFTRFEIIGISQPNLRGLLGGKISYFSFYGGVENFLYNSRFFLIGVEIKD